jgi:hypothetical protein
LNIVKFLDDHDVYYTDTGHNVKNGNINVKCPYCGEADKSEHLGIAIAAPHVWGCWRNKNHRGKLIEDLIVALTNYSWAEAKQIAKADSPQLEGARALTAVKEIFGKKDADDKIVQGVEYLEMPKEFNIIRHVGIYRKFHSYLWSRGFVFHEIQELIDYYGLRGCLRGEDAYRLIIPVYFEKKLVSWTGRTIGSGTLRYKDLSPDKSVIPLKESLFDFDSLHFRGGTRLYLVEGAFDCFPMHLHGKARTGITCSFTVNLSERQKYLLKLLSERFDEVVILPDPKFEIKAWELKNELSYLKNVYVQILPKHVEDPGTLTKQEVRDLVRASVKK